MVNPKVCRLPTSVYKLLRRVSRHADLTASPHMLRAI
jgi:hypothetical protein